jgi:2-keto-3-deoxy-L-rhamnonate aldolase RhmA
VVHAYQRVHAACAAHGKHLGMGGIYDNPTMEKYIALGARFVLGGSDLTFIMTAGQARADFLRGLKLDQLA